jgi:hypothetical protein
LLTLTSHLVSGSIPARTNTRVDCERDHLIKDADALNKALRDEETGYLTCGRGCSVNEVLRKVLEASVDQAPRASG